MMIFNSFNVANDNNFGAQRPNGSRVFLPTNKTFEGIYLARSLAAQARGAEITASFDEKFNIAVKT